MEGNKKGKGFISSGNVLPYGILIREQANNNSQLSFQQES
jgi:hypothetical protein